MSYEGTVLAIAGSDSGGGAGIQADLKTFLAFNVFGASVVTAVTAQSTSRVSGIHNIPVKMIAGQIDVVMEDMYPDTVKTGMLSRSETIRVVANKVKQYGLARVVVDPVMVSKSGDRLLQEEAVQALRGELLPVAFLVTPNLPEAEILSNMRIASLADAKRAAEKIHTQGAANVIIKGVPAETDDATDMLFNGTDYQFFSSMRVASNNVHGSGCTYASAIAACLSKGLAIPAALEVAKDYVEKAIRQGPQDIGSRYRPLHHKVVPISISAFEDAAEDFNRWFSGNERVFESELRAEQHFISEANNAVSIGVGSGLFASRLGITVGVEPSRDMARLAEQKGIAVKIGRAEAVPFPDEQFDTVLLSTVLSYVKDPVKALGEAFRILRSGGQVVVSFLAREGAYAMMYELALLRGMHDPEVAPAYPYPVKFIKGARWLSTPQVADMLKQAGFVDLEFVQTLTTHPRYTNEEVEEPRPGYKHGDYIVIRGHKP